MRVLSTAKSLIHNRYCLKNERKKKDNIYQIEVTYQYRDGDGKLRIH